MFQCTLRMTNGVLKNVAHDVVNNNRKLVNDVLTELFVCLYGGKGTGVDGYIL